MALLFKGVNYSSIIWIRCQLDQTLLKMLVCRIDLLLILSFMGFIDNNFLKPATVYPLNRPPPVRCIKYA